MRIVNQRKKQTIRADTEQIQEFEKLIRQQQRPLVAIAYRMLSNWEDARDVAQETFIRFWQSEAVCANDDSASIVLRRILINLCIDRLRRQQRFKFFAWFSESSEPLLPAVNNPEHEFKNAELKNQIDSATARLKPRQKAVFILRDLEGHSVHETANILGCSENNVLVNLHLARKNLRKWLLPYLKE